MKTKQTQTHKHKTAEQENQSMVNLGAWLDIIGFVVLCFVAYRFFH